MNNTDTFESSVLLKVKVSENSGSADALEEAVSSDLKTKYNEPFPEIIAERLREELEISHLQGFTPVFFDQQKIMQRVRNCDYPVYSIGANSASLIEYALGVTSVNPLPPHYRCTFCRHTEFIIDNSCDAGILLPEKVCPVCGKKMTGDGHDLPIESFLGYRRDKAPSLSLGVSSAGFRDTVYFLKENFDAVQPDPPAQHVPYEEKPFCSYVSVVSFNNLHESKSAVRIPEMNDPRVYELLSAPESYGCYIRCEEDIPLVKELLGCTEIRNFSDLYKICGIIYSVDWLPCILPRIKNGSADYRTAITNREDIYNELLKHQIQPKAAFNIMEKTRKGLAAKLFEDKLIPQLLLAHGVTEEYINDLMAIRYIPSRAQTTEFAKIAYENAWRRLYG